MMKKNKKDDIDTETTFADMNVEGFKWYNPDKKNNNTVLPLSKEEKRAMMKAAYSNLIPIISAIIFVMLLLVGIAYLWLS